MAIKTQLEDLNIRESSRNSDQQEETDEIPVNGDDFRRPDSVAVKAHEVPASKEFRRPDSAAVKPHQRQPVSKSNRASRMLTTLDSEGEPERQAFRVPEPRDSSSSVSSTASRRGNMLELLKKMKEIVTEKGVCISFVAV